MGAIFGFTGPPDRSILQRMSVALLHRGDHDVVLDENPHASIGYRGRFEATLRQELGVGLYRKGDHTIALAGHPTHTHHLSDLLDLYRQHGIRFVNALRGSFVLAVSDGHTVHLARDLVGARTIYYAHHKKRFLFTVEPFFSNPRAHGLLNKLMAINIRLKGAHLILPKVERMTAAWGITPLSPLFDERLIELSFQMPPRLKLSGGIEKVVLKQAYADLLPQQIINRPKSGMRVPVHYWFRGELKRYARKILSPRQVKRVGIFKPRRVKQLLDYQIEEGPGRYGLRLWMLITFEIWRRIVIEKETI